MDGGDRGDGLNAEHYGVAIQTSGMGIWKLSTVDGFVCLDRRGCEIHGLDPDAQSPLHLADYLALVCEADRTKLEDVLAGQSHRNFRDLELRLVDSSKGDRWIRLSGNTEKNSDGDAVAILGSCFDISEYMNMNRQLVQAQKMEAVGQLTAGIAHNFNNILSAVIPSLHLVTPHVKPEGAKLIRNAQLAAERASTLISELMVVAGRKTGKTRRALDVAVVVERVVRICRTTFGGWIQLNLDYDRDLPSLLANESQIEQVLLNLLLNARDAFEESAISCPRIDVEIEVEDERIVLRVVDNGPGMDPKTVAHIFEPFFTTKGAGTGLGLATARAIVSEHAGTIECWSKLDGGTEFRMTFPSHHEAVEPVPEVETASFVGGSERILVVDDDPLVRKVTAAALREAGYDVIEAISGSEALAKQASDALIDLIVLDMAMPELTGDMVLEEMRVNDPKVKVLVFTGLSDSRVQRLSDVAVLQKPADLHALLHAVRSAIDTRIN